jgi:curved DNA-binding protein CbpA
VKKKLDPYEELGVPKDADRAAVRRAYRRRASQTHPDKGGSAEAFKRTCTAMAVLTNPARRERYDNTGTVEEDQPDNARAGALQVIAKHLGDALNPFLAGGMQNAQLDPRRRDILAEVRAAIAAEIAKGRQGIAIGEASVEFSRDMASRFIEPEKDAFLRRLAEDGERGNLAQIERLREQVAAHEKALELLGDRGFRWDAPPAPVMSADLGGGCVRTFTLDPRTGVMTEVNPSQWSG